MPEADRASSLGPSPGVTTHTRAARRLMKQWREGRRPDVVSFLAEEGPLEIQERIAVLRADQRLRWRAGDRVPAEAYFDRFPDVEAEPELALDLIYGEYSLREEAGEFPDIEEYVGRFPEHEEVIRLQVSFFVMLGPDGRPPAGTPRTGYPEFPGYQILGVQGTGGMGIVYRAYQHGLQRLVALKMIQWSARHDIEQLRRFQVEAQAAARLHHPNIVEVYEIGELDGDPYFSLELIEGPDLSSEIGGQPLAVDRAARMVSQLARAMQYAHEKGVIHRDLKPANILLTAEGQPKITDFGLAKFHGGTADQTQSGTVIGSPCYMSPEQAGGRTREIGPASDIYSLGAILYEMLTGRPPFSAETSLETIRQILELEPVRPTRRGLRIPRDLETICLKCLEKQPRRRYSSAVDLADDLQRFLNYESIQARPAAAPERVWRWGRRKMTLAVALGLASVAIATTVGLSISLAVYHSNSARNLGTAYQTVEKALRDVQAGRREVDQLAANLSYKHGHMLCEKDDVGQGVLWLCRTLRAADQVGDPGLERAARLNIAAWRSRIHPMKLRWERSGVVWSAAYSPDGRMVATSGDDATRLWDAATGDPIGSALPHPGYVRVLAFSPDGRRLLTGCEDGLARLWDLSRNELAVPPLKHADLVSALAFSPDGRMILTGSYDRTAQLWDSRTGQQVGAPFVHEKSVAAVAFSPDGKTVATAGWDATARLWDVETRKSIGRPLEHSDPVRAVAFSPDGKLIMTGCFDRTVRLWDRDTGSPVGQPLRHQHCVNTAAFSPDSRMVLAGTQDGTARLWEVETGRPIGNVLRHRHAISSVGFSPDGRTMLTSGHDGAVIAWDVLRPPTVRTFGHDGFIRAVIFSPDGRHILSASQDKTARLWDAETGQPIGEPARHDGSVETVAFSPDGKTFLTGSEDGTARHWLASNGKALEPPLRHQAEINAVAFSPDGLTILTGSNDRTARLWDGRTRAAIGTPMIHSDHIKSVSFSPDGRIALTASWDRTARLWDAASGQPIGTPMRHRGRVLTAAFSPDGRAVLTGSDDLTARLWDVKTVSELIPPLKHQGPVSLAAFGPDGRTLITGGWDRVARLWDRDTGHPKAPPLRHDGLLRSLAFSPDGRAVLTGSYDRTAQLWEKATSLPVGPPFQHESQVWFVKFSPDGRRIVSGGQENKASLWNVPEADEGPIDRIDLALQITTGMDLEPDGSLRILNTLEWNQRRKQLIHRYAVGVESVLRHPQPDLSGDRLTEVTHHAR